MITRKPDAFLKFLKILKPESFFFFVYFFYSINCFAAVTVTNPSLNFTPYTAFPSAYQTLGTIEIAEAVTSDFVSNSGTIVLTIPANFEFKASTGSVAVSGGDLTGATITVTTTTITINYTTDGGAGGAKDKLTITGIQIRAMGSATNVTITNTSVTGTITGYSLGMVHGTLSADPAPLSFTIGTGTSTSAVPTPYRGYYWSVREQYIITASELTAAGLTSGSSLTSLSFNVSTKASTQAYTGFTIKIGHTASSSFPSSTFLAPAFTTCYNGNYTTASGWNLHTFSSSFTWNGSDNIVVEACFSNSSYTSSDEVYYSTATNSVCYADMDAAGGCSFTGETTSSNRPNMKFGYTPGAPCSGTPTGGTTSASPSSMCNAETSLVTLSGATNSSGITYQWQSSPDNSAWSNIGGATSTTYSASPSSSTYYRCVVTCTNSGMSANSTSSLLTVNSCIIFGTGTSTTSSYPYVGGFDDGRSQFIITAAELTTAGLCPGSTLNSLSFNVSTKNSTAAYKSFTINMGHTTTSNFPSATWLAPSFTQVFSTNFTTATGWNLHTFSTGFVWNGSDNVVVQTCFNNTDYTSSDYVYYTTAADNKVCYAEMDGGAGCSLAAEYTSTSRPNMKFNYSMGANCSGTPTAGSVSASPSTVCPGGSTLLSLSGQTIACGLTYQWQSSPEPITVWSNIGGATSTSYLATPGASTNYRCVVTCTPSGLSANSSGFLVVVGDPSYASIPYSQSFEGPWLSYCNTRDIPASSWKNTPGTGNDSWRRDDDGGSAAWSTPSGGSYSPSFTDGSYSARFHSAWATSGLQGNLDLYVNLSPAGTKSLCFDYINTSGTDVLTVLLSTNGGSTFPTTLITLPSNSGWTSQTVNITSTSATCVVRFRGTSDYGSTDIGIDNIFLGLPPVPNCATYDAPSNGATNIICGIDALLNWTQNGPTCFPPTSYDVYFGTNPSPPFLANQTGTMYNPGTLSVSTTYYWKIQPRNGAGAASCATVWSFTTGATFNLSQTSPPISDGFEDCLDWTVVNGSQANKWLRGTATANTGSYSMYINNTASNNNYDNTVISTVHFYKDITFPSSTDNTLSFNWKGDAEGCCDELTVYFAPTTVIPAAGSEMSTTYQIGTSYNVQTTWQNATMTLPAACSGETRRLVFSWHNDGSTGPNPPAAVDNISITSVPRTGNTCANPVTINLPYTKTGETTQCMGDDYNNTSTPCSSNNYVLGEDKVYKALIGAAGCVSFALTNASSTSIGFQVYSGCPDAGGTCIANSGGATGTSLTADVNIPSAGYYFIVVDNWGPTPSYVTYDISISAPGNNITNDGVCSATSLTLGVGGTGDNTCTNANGEPAVPACWTTGTMNTVWYRVTIPASKDVAVKTTAGTLTETQIAIYAGNACGSLSYMDCNDNAPSCGSSSYSHSYLLVEGINNTYAYIRVDGEGDLTGTFSILAVDGNNGSPVWPSMPGQDCGPAPTSSSSLCGTTTTIDNPGFLAYGNSCDFPGGGSNCLLSGERSTVWYRIPINANTPELTFDIIPNDYPGSPSTAGSDYDFALWKVVGSGAVTCADISAGAAPLKCNYSGLGVTGLSTSGNSPGTYPGFDGAYETEQPVSNGEEYILVISNYEDDYVSGFTLNMLTTPVAYTPPGATLNWAGGSSSDWNLAGNWGACTDPLCTVNASVSSGGAQPVISSNAFVKDLTINAGATVTINANCTLTVCGNFVNNGNLAMASTATLLFNNGSVVQNLSGTLTGVNKIGNLVIDKTGGSVILAASTPIEIAGNFVTQNSTSIFNANSNVVKIAGNFSTASASTITNFANIEFNGTIPQTYSNSSGTITWTNVTMNNSGGGITLSGGATSNLVIAGVLTLTNGIIYTANPPLLVMNSGSSATSGSSSSFVGGPMQKIGNTDFVFPVGDAFTRWARIGISGITAATTFQAQYFFTTCSTCANTMAGSPSPVLNNVSGFEYWQLDKPGGAANATVTLYWENAAASGINSCAGAPNTGDLVVARYNGAAWENKNVTGGSYNGSACSGTTAGSVTSDLVTSFSPFSFGSKSSAVNPLPIELLYFSGKIIENQNILEWKTASEINNDFFTLEKSVNGYEFTDLSFVEGAGNSTGERSYRFVDNYPTEGKNYYRLKQTDFDGGVKYAANLVVLEWLKPVEYKIFPNPASGEIFIYNSNGVEKNVQIEITDIYSRKVVEQKLFVVGGSNAPVTIDIRTFSEGVYFVSFRNPSGKPVSLKKFVKMK